MKPLFAICGLAGAGKDSLANHLIAKYGFAKAGFAFPLKQLCCDLYGWDFASLENLAYKQAPSDHESRIFTREEVVAVCVQQFGHAAPIHVTHLEQIFAQIYPDHRRRQILQHVGTEGFRALDPNHWVKKALHQIWLLLDSDAQGVVITDVRFPNESFALKERFDNVITVRVDCDGRPEATIGSESQHSSETQVMELPVDHVIEAAFGDLPGLYAAGEALL